MPLHTLSGLRREVAAITQVFAVVLRPGHGSTWDLSGSWDSPLDSITLQFFKSPLSGFETASEAYAA